MKTLISIFVGVALVMASREHAFAAETPVPEDRLLLWLRADAGVQSEASAITAWRDSSAAKHDATRDAEYSKRLGNPSLITDVANGHAVLRFDGSDCAFTFPRQTNIRTVFWVVAKDAKSIGQHNERFVLGDGSGKDFHVGTHQTAFILHPSESSAALRSGVARVNGAVVDPRKTDFPQQLAIISMVASGDVSADQISRDRAFKDRSWQGDIAEIILYSRALPDAERQQVEEYLTAKYGVKPEAEPGAKQKEAAYWPRWRGPHGDGLSDASHIPIHWSATENVTWKTEVEGTGNSSPCIWGERIFLTSAIGSKTNVKATQVLCFDRANGKPLWKTQVPLPEGTVKAPSENNGWATPTVATDGKHVVAAFATGALACLSVEGKLLWTYDLGPLDHMWGLASSPVIHGGRIYYSVDQGKRSKQPSFMVALDLETGGVAWRQPIATSGERGYSTPLFFGSDPQQLLLWAGNQLTASDPSTGAELWNQAVFSLGEPITTPLLIGANTIIVAQSDHAMALEAGPQGAKPRWSIDFTSGARIARMANNIVYRDRLYAVSDAGKMSCYDIADGKRLWSEDIDDKFYAAPVAAAGYVIFTGRSGKSYVVRPGDTFDLADINTLGEPCDASPAIADGRIYLRTKRGAEATTLWCIADQPN